MAVLLAFRTKLIDHLVQHQVVGLLLHFVSWQKRTTCRTSECYVRSM